MADDSLEVLDYVLLCGYFVVVMCVGLFATFRANRGNTEGFFLAGKSMTWLPIAGSIFATNIGAPMFVGITGSAASVGVAPVMFEWHATYTLVMLGWIFVPIYMASGTYTMPEYLKKRYGGRRLRVFYAFVQLILTILTGISAELYAGSLFIKQILGWNIYLSTIAILLITSVYTIGGGLTAVIYTDALQTVILISGATVLAVLAFAEVGGYEPMTEQFLWSASNNSFYYNSPDVGGNLSCGFVPENSFHIMRGIDSDYPWPGLVFGLTLLATYYWCTNQIIVQRNLAAKNMAHSKMACVTASFLKLLPFVLFVIPGMTSRILYSDEIACSDPDFCEEICDNPSGCSDIAYPLLVLRIMPIGMKGVMLAAMLAALMSSLTSQYNSSSSIFSMDIWKFYKRSATDRELVIVGRVFGGVMVLLSIGWLPILQMLQGTRLWDYIQSISAYVTPPWVVVFILGMFWKRATEQGAFWSVMAGLVVGVIRMFIDFSNPAPDCGSGDPDNRPDILTDVHYLHFAIISAAIALTIHVVVSILTKPRSEQQLRKVMWQTRLSEQEPELTVEEEDTASEPEPNDPDDETKCQRFYNFACGFSAAPAKKLDPEELKEHLRKMHDISENKTTSRLCDISAVVAVAATCAIIGFYA